MTSEIQAILLIFSGKSWNKDVEDVIIYTDMPLQMISKIKLNEAKKQLAYKICYCFDKESDRWYKFRTNSLGNTFVYVRMIKKINQTTLLKYQQFYQLSQAELLVHPNQQIRVAALAYLKKNKRPL